MMTKDKTMTDLKNRRKEIEQVEQKMKRFSLNLDSTIRLMQKVKVKLLLQNFKEKCNEKESLHKA